MAKALAVLLALLLWFQICGAWLARPLFPVSTTQVNVWKLSAAFVNKTMDQLADSTVTSSSLVSAQVRSVNYHLTRECNYACKFCFHTQKTKNVLSITQAKQGLALLKEAGTKKVNFAGGEPFLQPDFLGQLCKAAHKLGMAVSIISNGSLITREWVEQYGYFVDILGVSIDSFSPITNLKIGRGIGFDDQHIQRVTRVREWCREFDIKFKVNTVVCSLNWQEDMTQQMQHLDPCRWKVFQVLILQGENGGGSDLRNAKPLAISTGQYNAFVERHAPRFAGIIVPESNEVMQNSYLLLDEQLRFLDCSTGSKLPSSESILDVGVERALAQAGFDLDMFHQRGGVYKWTRNRGNDLQQQQHLKP